jgi:hypothetical protein
MTEKAPRAPVGLAATGKRLWRDLSEAYSFRPDERVLVVELCRLSDDLERLRRDLADEPATVTGSTGQMVVHPLRLELHRTSGRFESVVRTLGLPDETESAGSNNATWAGRNLARARWS